MIKSYAQEKNVALYTFIGGLHEEAISTVWDKWRWTV